MTRLIAIAFSLLVPVSICHAQVEAIEPTENHAVLKQDVGKWNAEVKLFAPESDEPQVSKGVEFNELVCDGIWLRTHYKGEFFGTTFEGIGMIGYDTSKEKYVGTWGDNFTSSMATMEGEYDAEKKTLTFNVKGVGLDGQEQESTQTIKYNDDGSRTMIMESNQQKVLEIHYTRRRSGGGSSNR